MTMLVFLLAITAIAATVVAVEGSSRSRSYHAGGLLRWFLSGNWPAKIGATMVVVATGALLRYAGIHVDLPPEAKLASGIVIAALLGFASMFTSRGAGQRTLSMVLGGAAFGVAYLTAYSGFALFGFLASTTGIGLMVLTAVATGCFAVKRNALSLALLAMIGAYLAPAFSVTESGPYVTYGYYIAATALTAYMVAMRGWRPLIHLNFLFTLVGGVFFAWTARYYTPEHIDAMAPMLWVLVALHIFLPIIERRHVASAWIKSLDIGYLVLLPLAATILAASIAPSPAVLCALLVVLGFTWVSAALFLRLTSREGSVVHAAIGLVLMALGVAARFRGLPWDVIALSLAVGALALAVHRETSDRLHNFLAGGVLLLGAVHAFGSLAPAGAAFVNGEFVERCGVAGLLVYAAHLCRKVRQPLDGILLYSGIGWAVIAVATEVLRLELISPALALHWLLLAFAIGSWLLGSRIRVTSAQALIAVLGILGTALVAVSSASGTVSIVSLLIAPIALLALATRQSDESEATADRPIAVIAMPLLAVVWALHISAVFGIDTAHFAVIAGAATAVGSLIVARFAQGRSAAWKSEVVMPLGIGFLVPLTLLTTLAIGRTAWAMAAEVVCLAGLGMLTVERARAHDPWLRPALIVGATLTMQAHLLRWFGPEGALTIDDIARMDWPTLVSLLWVAVGAGLTIWGRKKSTRTLWVGGAALLIAAAVKLVAFDFGALGELRNILAFLAAGIMFLLVGWLAPMPPAASKDAAFDREDAAPGARRSAVRAEMESSPEGRVMPEEYWNRRDTNR